VNLCNYVTSLFLLQELLWSLEWCVE